MSKQLLCLPTCECNCKETRLQITCITASRIGNGELLVDYEGLISIPPGLGQVVENVEALYRKVFPNLNQNYKNHSWLCERVILAPRNDIVNAINTKLLMQLPGEKVLKSINTVVDATEAVQYPTEFFNALEPSGMALHKLRLKVGCPVILLLNLDAPKLCNGTRLIIKQIMAHATEATVLTGQGMKMYS